MPRQDEIRKGLLTYYEPCKHIRRELVEMILDESTDNLPSKIQSAHIIPLTGKEPRLIVDENEETIGDMSKVMCFMVDLSSQALESLDPLVLPLNPDLDLSEDDADRLTYLAMGFGKESASEQLARTMLQRTMLANGLILIAERNKEGKPTKCMVPILEKDLSEMEFSYSTLQEDLRLLIEVGAFGQILEDTTPEI